MMDEREERMRAELVAEIESEGGDASDLKRHQQVAEGEQYDAGRHGAPQPQQEIDYAQFLQENQPKPLPPMMDDPVGHFDGRMRQIEGHAGYQAQVDQGRNIRDFVEQSEKAAKEETYGDYQEAVEFLEKVHVEKINRMFPDGPQADTLAHQYGLQNAEHLRAAIFERDRQSVIHQAITHGVDPAGLYYQHALSYGYRPQVGFTRSQTRRLVEAAEEGGETFDKLWNRYAQAERQAEQNRRSRR
jgi:hypothetical protein